MVRGMIGDATTEGTEDTEASAGVEKNVDDAPRDRSGDNDLTSKIIAAAIEVHRQLGPGLLESAYEACLAHELVERGIAFERQKLLPVQYKGITIDAGYRLDLLVERRIIVELKAVDRLTPIHEAQMLTYLRLANCRIGLLLNFNAVVLRKGIRRMVWDPRDD